jgi:hypothetical protein
MGPLTKLAFLFLGCSFLICGTFAVRAVYRLVFNHHVLAETVASRSDANSPTSEVQERADPVEALSALTDFKKLSTLRGRAINPRLNKTLYWLYVAENNGMLPERVIDEAFVRNGNSSTKKATAAKAQMVANYRAAKLWGAFTVDALAKLKRGEAIRVTRGSYTGQFIEVDHIVPVARYPQFANELANLQLLPQSENRRKGDRMGDVEFAKLAELHRLR